MAKESPPFAINHIKTSQLADVNLWLSCSGSRSACGVLYIFHAGRTSLEALMQPHHICREAVWTLVLVYSCVPVFSLHIGGRTSHVLLLSFWATKIRQELRGPGGVSLPSHVTNLTGGVGSWCLFRTGQYYRIVFSADTLVCFQLFPYRPTHSSQLDSYHIIHPDATWVVLGRRHRQLCVW